MARNKVRSVRLGKVHDRMLEELQHQLRGTHYNLVKRCLEYGLEAANSGVDVFERNGCPDSTPKEAPVQVSTVLELLQVIERLTQRSELSHSLALNNALDNFEIINWLRMIGETVKPGHTDAIERKITDLGKEVMRIASTPPLNSPTGP